MADIKLYGASQNAFRYKILAQTNEAFKSLAAQKSKEIDNLIAEFIKKDKDWFSKGLNLGLDALGSIVSGVVNGTLDFVKAGELVLKQFGADIAYDVDKDGKETINDWGYASANMFLDAAAGLHTWASATAADASQFLIKGAIELDPNGYLAQMTSFGLNRAQTSAITGVDDGLNPLGDLMNFYGPGGAGDTLKNWWDEQKADLRRSELGKSVFETSFTAEQIEANQDLIKGSYSQSFYRDVEKMFEASAERRALIDNMFQNKEITELIQQGGEGSGFAEFTRGVSQSIGRMLPSIAVAMLTGKVTKGLNIEAAKTIAAMTKFASNLYFAGSVFGQSMEQAITNGASYDDALTYAYGSALSEMVIENTSGIIIGEQMTVTSFKSLFKQMLSEAGEEAIAEMGSAGFAKMYIPETQTETVARSAKVRDEEQQYDGIVEAPKEEKAMDYLSRIFMSALSGAVSGGVMGVGNVVRATYTAEGRAETAQQILQQNIKEIGGAKVFAKEASPRVQKTLNDLKGTKLTQEQKDEVFFASPALSKVISRNVSKDGTISFDLNKAGERLVNQGEVSAFQGKKSITSQQYAMSNDLFLEELTESFDTQDAQGNPVKVKVKILERQALENLDQATQQKVKETLKDFDNVIFVEMDEGYNSYVDPSTGAVYININAADKADGFRALYAHEIHDYVRTLREQGKLEPQAAKAYDKFIKLLTNKKSVDALFSGLPKEMMAIVRQVQENYEESEQPRELASFFIQKILAAKEGGIKGLETLLAAKEGGFLNFLRIFTNETMLSRLMKQFGKSQDLTSLLDGLDRAFGAAIAQSKEFLTKREGIVFANQYLQNLLVMGDEELEAQPEAAKLAFSLGQRYPMLNAMVEDSQEAIDLLNEEFVEKFESIFLTAGDFSITEELKEDNTLLAKNLEEIIKGIEKPKNNYVLGGMANENLLYFGQEKIVSTLKKLSKLVKEGAYYDSALEQVRDDILDAFQVKVFALDSKERKAGFIFSSRNVFFAKQDFTPFLEKNQNRVYQPRFNFVHNTMEITHLFRTGEDASPQNMWYRTTHIGGNILNDDLTIRVKNPLVLGSVLNQQALSFLLQNNFLGSQSFSINNFGALDTTLGTFTDALRPSLDTEVEPDFVVKVIFNPEIVGNVDTIVGKDDLYTPTRNFDNTLSATYRMKYQQAGEKSNLSEPMGYFSFMEVFKNTIDYVAQNRTMFGVPKDVKKITERNFGDVKMAKLLPNNAQQLQVMLDRISMSNALARRRQDAAALKKDINDANYFYNIPDVQSVVESLASSIETIKTSVLNGDIEPDEFVEIIRELVRQGVYVLGESNQNSAFEGRTELKKKYESLKKELHTIAYVYHFYNYQTTKIAEGKAQISPNNIEVIHLTRFKNKKSTNENYEKTIEWAKQNNIKVVETVDLYGAEDATFDHTRIPMRQTNDHLLERSKVKRVFLSKAGYNVDAGQDVSMDYREVSDARESINDTRVGINSIETVVARTLNLYAYDAFLNAYGVKEINKDRTEQQQIALANGIKNTLNQVISKALVKMNNEERVTFGAVFLAVDSFMKLELNTNLMPITNKLKEDVATIGAFEKRVKQTIINNQQVMTDAGLSLNDYVYSKRTNEIITRGESLRVLAQVYKAYTEAFVSKISTVTNYSVIQNVLPEQMETIKEFDNAFFADDKAARSKIGMYKTGELTTTGLDVIVLEALVKSKQEDFQKKYFLTNPALKSQLAKEGFLKNNEQMNNVLYEEGYDFGFSFKEHAIAFKTGDFNVGENEAIANIRFVNVSGVAPAFTFTVYSRNGDRLEYVTNRMVYGAFVTEGRVVPNPMVIEFGTSFENARRILTNNKIYAQSASISPLEGEISPVSRYAHHYPIGNLGFIKVKMFVNPSSLNKGNNVVLPTDGWFADKEQVGNRLYLANAIDKTQKELPVSQRQGSFEAKTEDEIRKFDFKLASRALTSLVVSKDFQDSVNFAVEADDFGTYINMNALEGFIKVVAATGLSEAKSKQSVSEIKLQIEMSSKPEYRAEYFAMVDNFYETFVLVYNELKTNDVSKNRNLVSTFGALVQAYYEQNKRNYRPMASILSPLNSNYALAIQISQKYGGKIAKLANIIDILPFRTTNTNEVRYNALDVQDIKVMQVDMMAKQENIEAMTETAEMKDLLSRAKEKGIEVVLVNQSKTYEGLSQNVDEVQQTMKESINPENKKLLKEDTAYLEGIQSRLNNESTIQEMEKVSKAASTRYLVATKLMFSKSQRIKDARQKKSREVMEEGKGRVIEQSIVPTQFQDTKQEIKEQEQTRTSVSKVSFDTSLSKLDVKSNLYKVLVRNLKTIKILLEFQKDKNFKKQYPAEAAIIGRAITDLNRQKARIENLLGVKEPISPYDPNLVVDTENTEVQGIREALAEYRTDISTLYKAQTQTTTIMAKMESVLTQAINTLDKEADASKQAINQEGEVAVKPTTILEMEDIAKDLAKQPTYQRYLNLLSGLKQVNKLLNSSFAAMDSNIREALGKFKYALEGEISRILNKAGIQIKDPLNTNISILNTIEPYFAENAIKSFEQKMYEMTTFDIKNNYPLLIEKRQDFSNRFAKETKELQGISDLAIQFAQENITLEVEQQTKQLETEQKVIEAELVERKMVNGELAFVLRKLIDARERNLYVELDNAKTPAEEAPIRKLLSEINILRRSLKQKEVKVSNEVLVYNRETLNKIKKDFVNTKSFDSFMQLYGDMLKIKEPAKVSNEKTAAARETVKEEKTAKEPYKQKYNGPVYVTIDDLRMSPGINSVLGKVIFKKPMGLSKGKDILIKPAGQNVVYKPNTRKQQDQINGQVYVVEKARTELIKAQKVLATWTKKSGDKLASSNKKVGVAAFKEAGRLQDIIEKRRENLSKQEEKLATLKRQLDIVETVEQTPALIRTVGQKIYPKAGVEIQIPDQKITKYFFNLVKAFDYINDLIHTQVLKNKGKETNESNTPPASPIATPTAASVKETMPLEPFVNAFATPAKAKQEAAILPTQKPAQMWIPLTNITVVFGDQAYTLTPQEVQNRITNGDWNFSSEEQYIQYQKLILQTMSEQAQKKAQDAKTQQAIQQQTMTSTPIANQNIPMAQGVNFFKQAALQATINQPNQYEINEKRWASIIQVIEERLKMSNSKDDQRLYQAFVRLKQIIYGYRTDNRMYNHMSMAVSKVIIEEFDKFARSSSNNTVYIPNNSDLQNVIDRVNGAIFAVLEYIDTNLLVKINVSPDNPKGYLFWKGSYWYFRGMKDVKNWDKTQTDLYAKDYHGNAYRRLTNALFNFNSKGFGMLELISALEEFDRATAVPPVADLAIDGKEARTVETNVKQWYSDAKTNEEIGATANFNIKPAGTSLLDPYTIAEIVGQFDDKSWAMTAMNKIIEGQERAFEVDKVFEETFSEEWQKKNNSNLIDLEKNTKPIVNLEGKSIPMSQIIYLRNMLLREIVRNRMIDIGVVKGEKTHHFDNGSKVDILAITEVKEKKDRNKVVAKIVDQNALLQELDTLINQDSFAKSYNEKIYDFMGKTYPLINERFKEIQGANLVNDGETIVKAIPTMSQTELQKLKDILPQGMQPQDAARLYIPFLLSSGSYFKSQKVNFKDVLDMGVFDGMVSNLTDTNAIVSVESITNVLTSYQQETRNYYGFHRFMKDFNLVLNTSLKDEDTGQTIFLERYLPKWATDYFERLVMDAAGYGQVDQGNEAIRKWLPMIRRNFYTSAIGLNLKVITTQFASFLNLWNIYGQSDMGFLGKMIKNLASQAAPSQKVVLEQMAQNNLHYWARSKGGTFEIGEATKEGVKAKNIIQTLREFSMKGITLTDNMINKAFYLTLLESVNPKTNQTYTPEEASNVLTKGIIRSQSTKEAVGKASILRSKNELVRIMVKFLGEPMKMTTQLVSSYKNIELIEKLKKNQNRIANNVQAKIAVEQVKVLEAKNKLAALESVENSTTFATESEEFQQTTRDEIERARRQLQEANERLKDAQDSGKRTLDRVSRIIASESEVRRLGRGRITAFVTTLNFLVLLGFGLDMLRSGGGERDKERDEELWEYMMKKLGGRYIDEIVGMVPFARDIYGAFKGYDFGGIGEFQSINAVSAQIGNIFRGIAEGENINWNRTSYNLAVGVGQLLGVPVKSIERLFTTPLYYFNEPAFYQYNTFIGGPDRDNIELAQAIKDNDLQMISVIVDRKISKRDIRIHVDVKNEIKKIIGQGFDVSIVGIPDKVTEDGLERKLTSEEKVEFAEVYSRADAIVRKLLTSSKYNRLTGKYKARLIQAVYNYYYKYAKQDILGIDTLSEDLTFTSLNQAYTYFLGRVEAYRKEQVKDADRIVPTISLLD
jgi:hypothetical protein